MDVLALKDEGVVAVWGLKQDEYQVTWNERQKEIDAARMAGRPVSDADVRVCETPVWQRVCGLGSKEEWRLRPFERRGALLRLARTVERMIRAEWKKALGPKQNENDPFADGEPERDFAPCRYATRTALWDPVAEICHYLEIAQTKLSDLLRQGTGLRAREISDCVRAEEIRSYLKEKIRRAARGWLKSYTSGSVTKAMAELSPDEGAAIVLGEYRSGPDFLDRDGWVKQFGLGSRTRLYRAVQLAEGMDLADLERIVALEVFTELMPELWVTCGLTKDEVAGLVKEVAVAKVRVMQACRTD